MTFEQFKTTYKESDKKADLVLESIQKGDFDTPKKLNRSEKKIPQTIIDQIEGGEFTSEMMAELAKKFPIFTYKSCLTIHGDFPDIVRAYIGNYKNIRQNANGSLEVLYSAIDLDKVRNVNRIAGEHGIWRLINTDSRGHFFNLSKPVRNQAELDAAKTDFYAKAKQLTLVPFTGHISIWLSRDQFGGISLYLTTYVYTIKAGAEKEFVRAAKGWTVEQMAEAYEAEVEANKQREKEQAERDAARKAKEDAYNELAAPYIAKLAGLKKASMPELKKGRVAVQVVQGNMGNPLYKFLKVELGTFGRVKPFYTTSREQVLTPDFTTDKVKEGKQEKSIWGIDNWYLVP